MYLLKVYSNKESFRTVTFNETGLSFIVAEQDNPESNDKGKTYNGVGKSFLVRIIHFCFGANENGYKELCEKLPDWEFYVDFKLGNNIYTVKRTTNEPNGMELNNELISVSAFRDEMNSLCFNIPKNITDISFRSLIPFFIRPKRNSYVAFNEPGKVVRPYQTLLFNSFLLGLDISLIQEKEKIKKELDRITTLEKNFKKDSLLKDFFTGNKDAVLTLVDLEERIQKLENSLKTFEVAENYREIQLKADKVEKELFTLNNDSLLLESNIEQINESFNFTPDISKESLLSVYQETNIHFSENLVKTLDDTKIFYEKLISNRKRRLVEQQNKLRLEKKNKENKMEILQRELHQLIRYLGEHQALDLFVSLNNQKAEYELERDSIKKYQALQAEYKATKRDIKKKFVDYAEIADQYLEGVESEINVLRDYFRSLAKTFYPDSIAGITIESNSGVNQLRFNIDAKIESDASDGINHVKIFCYDLTILFEGHNHNIDFIFHDSRLFSDTDERQTSDMFKLIYDKFSNSGKQYIATVNQNQLDEIKKQLTDEEFDEIITKNKVLTLTDKSDDCKLLGINVDIREE
ncbi:DUF2326 domain-containing protein [Methanolobus sp. ZRKC5]|uniref:DUF2326 domain-containing protein n=1 Tax=unclassified Methanolobus TaxID=2629569 RepID=UPI00313D9CEF